MNGERDRVATQLFLRRGQFRSGAPTVATVRLDAIDPEWARGLRMINYLATTAQLFRRQGETLDFRGREFLADLDWSRDRLEHDVAGTVPPDWVSYAREVGEHGIRLSAEELLPAPWIDHRARLVRSIGADIDRLTNMAAACVVRVHRRGEAGVVEETASADQVGRNLVAIRTSAARTAEAIGADAEECRQWWDQPPSQQWRAAVEAHLNCDPTAFDRRWSVYTDPAIDAHVDAYLHNLPLYAELARPPGTPPGSGLALAPRSPAAWLSTAARALTTALEAGSGKSRFDIGLDASADPDSAWWPPSGPTADHDESLPPNIDIPGADPWD
ncbi:hypothetical protein ACFYO1_02830 [Nocardia sp. NPDC006044]|uniref:hypothetical protein n=1 Tax=Nocardia sp. NPDC006044 TaxID=3364306 RepID=UPI0036CD212E